MLAVDESSRMLKPPPTLERLPENVELAITACAVPIVPLAPSSRPPPRPSGWPEVTVLSPTLFETVLLVISRTPFPVSPTNSPPPYWAWLPSIVLLRTHSDPVLWTPPPWFVLVL